MDLILRLAVQGMEMLLVLLLAPLLLGFTRNCLLYTSDAADE